MLYAEHEHEHEHALTTYQHTTMSGKIIVYLN